MTIKMRFFSLFVLLYGLSGACSIAQGSADHIPESFLTLKIGMPWQQVVKTFPSANEFLAGIDGESKAIDPETPLGSLAVSFPEGGQLVMFFDKGVLSSAVFGFPSREKKLGDEMLNQLSNVFGRETRRAYQGEIAASILEWDVGDTLLSFSLPDKDSKSGLAVRIAAASPR